MPDIPRIKTTKDDQDKFGEGLRGAPPILVDERPIYKGRRMGVPAQDENIYPLGQPKSMKRGGMVHKTAVYRLHAGERVLPRSMARRYMEEKHGGKMDAGSCQRD